MTKAHLTHVRYTAIMVGTITLAPAVVSLLLVPLRKQLAGS